jgi:hypothetical protein
MSLSNAGMPDAARVLIGPGETGLERRLDRAHDPVVRHDLGGAVIAHRDERAAAVHQGLGEPRHLDERMAGDGHRAGEAFARAVDDAAVEVGGRRVGDRVLHVERHRERRLELPRERLDVWTRLFIEPRHREFGANGAQDLGAPVRDAVLVRDAHHEALVPD